MSTNSVIINNVIPLALFIGLLLYLFFMQRKFNQKIKEVKEAHLLLSNYKDGLVSNILKVEKSYVLLNKDLDKKLKSVASESNQKIETVMQTVNELKQKNDALLRQKDEIIKEFKSMADPLKASFQNTLIQIKKFQDSISEPFDIFSRSLHKFIEGLDSMYIHESRKICTFHIVFWWSPDNVTTELKILFHW